MQEPVICVCQLGIGMYDANYDGLTANAAKAEARTEKS